MSKDTQENTPEKTPKTSPTKRKLKADSLEKEVDHCEATIHEKYLGKFEVRIVGGRGSYFCTVKWYEDGYPWVQFTSGQVFAVVLKQALHAWWTGKGRKKIDEYRLDSSQSLASSED